MRMDTRTLKSAFVSQLLIVIVFNLPESFYIFFCNKSSLFICISSPYIPKPSNGSSWCRCDNTYNVLMYFWSKADERVCEAGACPALLTASNTGVWLTRICQEDLSYEIRGIFCYAVLFPLKKNCGKWYVESSVSWVFQTTKVAPLWMLFCY